MTTFNRRIQLLLLGFWLLPAAVATLGLRLVPSRLNPDLSVAEILTAQLLIWLPWGFWSLLIISVGNRVPFERGNITRALATHAPISVLVVLSQILVMTAVTRAFGMIEPRGLESTIVIGIRQYGDLLMVIYWTVAGTHAGFRWHGRWQEESLRASKLREDLANANLEALRAQLNPHFLFNALNSVVALIGRDPESAKEMLVRLSDLLRTSLSAGGDQEAPLATEIALTARYLEIEQVRFADRLSVQWSIDSELSDALIPVFTLQPLVENAIRHGLSRRTGAGTIEIVARRDHLSTEDHLNTGDSTNTNDDTDSEDRTNRRSRTDSMVLEVRDREVSVPAASPARSAAGSTKGAGMALANLRARLLRLYGEDASVSLTVYADNSAAAVVRIPIRYHDPGRAELRVNAV